MVLWYFQRDIDLSRQNDAQKPDETYTYCLLKGHHLAIQQVPSAFEDQATWLDAIRQVSWAILPPDNNIPIYQSLQGRIVRLFSGRRRVGNVHCCLADWVQDKKIDVTFLSMDTAISITFGNLSVQSVSWNQLLWCYSCRDG